MTSVECGGQNGRDSQLPDEQINLLRKRVCVESSNSERTLKMS